MTATIKSVFAGLTTHIVIDAKFIQRIRDFAQGFVNRNEEHIGFFGGNLLGVNPIRFLPRDRDSWFDDVLTIDDLQLQDELHSLDTIETHRKIASDVMNHSCAWAIYAILNSTHLSPAQKEQGAIDTLLVLQYKYLSSILAHDFKYPADKAIALATYDALSQKFSLKACGSWSALLLKRAQNTLAHNSIHYQTLITHESDVAVVYFLNDTQGRLREIVKSLCTVFYRIKNSPLRYGTTKSTVEVDGITLLKDVQRNSSMYIRYFHNIVDDKQSFVRDELVRVICDAMYTMSPTWFNEVLTWISINHRVPAIAKDIDTLAEETLIFAYDLISNNQALQGSQGGLVNILTKLRALYMASRMADPVLVKTRDLAEHLVQQAVKTKNSTVIASLRTGLLLYIVLRSFSMKYYT
jgi:hypothetical protein